MSTEEERRIAIGKFLKHERLRRSFREGRTISQAELARICGVPQGSWSQWENGTRAPEDANAHKLAAVFGAVIYEILDMPMAVPKNKELVRVNKFFFKLTPDQQRKYADLIQDAAEEQEELTNLKNTAEITIEREH